jgi:hypothetical protein
MTDTKVFTPEQADALREILAPYTARVVALQHVLTKKGVISEEEWDDVLQSVEQDVVGLHHHLIMEALLDRVMKADTGDQRAH